MKKVFYFLATAAALFAFASCGEKPEDAPEIPAQIEVTITNLVKGDVVPGEINKLPVTASVDGVELELTFFSDKVYLAAGSYTVGQAIGNYEGKVKTKVVEAQIKSGTITVADDGNDGYTLTGTLRLDNEAGTIAKLNASGTLVYEMPTEYYYTLEKGADANVYKIFDLENHQLASAAVVGAEEGTFDVLEGKALPGAPNAGTWVWIDNFGTEIYLHGKVTVSTSHGKKAFKFEDNHTRIFNNCELKTSITPALIKGATDADDIFAMADAAGNFATATFTAVPSPVVTDMYEVTCKLFYPDGREFLSFVAITPDNDLPFNNPGAGQPSMVVSYDSYKNYASIAADLPGAVSGRIAPEGTCFYTVHGVKTEVLASDGFFALLNGGEKDGMKYALLTFLSSTYATPAALDAVSAGDTATDRLYALMGLVF
ncbi:MAG: hypothetical protein K5909_01340 [Bacteroidales bacterium]|nr:hypothetical protein [Bacteroidales bacterium]